MPRSTFIFTVSHEVAVYLYSCASHSSDLFVWFPIPELLVLMVLNEILLVFSDLFQAPQSFLMGSLFVPDQELPDNVCQMYLIVSTIFDSMSVIRRLSLCTSIEVPYSVGRRSRHCRGTWRGVFGIPFSRT